MAACAVAFAASAMVGLGAPAAAGAPTHSTGAAETTEFTAQAYYKEGTYSTLTVCRTVGSRYSEMGLPWYCEAVDTGGRPHYALYVWVG